MKTRAQDWSQYAFTLVHGEADVDPDRRSKYRTSCNKMPGLIHQSGVLQALVFQCARDAHGRRYVDHLSQTYFQPENADHRRLIEHAQQSHLGAYMALTRDIASIAQWFRRFAQIELPENENG